MFEKGSIYLIDNKPFRYDGHVTDREHYQFTSIDNPEDVRDVSVLASRYVDQIKKQKVR